MLFGYIVQGSLRIQQAFQNRKDLGHTEATRSRPPFVGHLALFIQNINPIRPGREHFFHAVFEIIHQDRKAHLELGREISGDFFALFQRFRIRDKDFFADILWYLPAVGGMCFFDIDDVNGRPVLVIFVELLDRTDRGAKRRSGTASEDEDRRLPAHLGKLDGFIAIQVIERDVRDAIADLEVPLARSLRGLSLELQSEAGCQESQPNNLFHGTDPSSFLVKPE